MTAKIKNRIGAKIINIKINTRSGTVQGRKNTITENKTRINRIKIIWPKIHPKPQSDDSPFRVIILPVATPSCHFSAAGALNSAPQFEQYSAKTSSFFPQYGQTKNFFSRSFFSFLIFERSAPQCSQKSYPSRMAEPQKGQ